MTLARRLLLAALSTGLLLTGPGAGVARAHDVGSTAVVLSHPATGLPGQVRLETQIPLDRLDFAYGTHLADQPSSVSEQRAGLTERLVKGVSLTSSGRQIPLTVGLVEAGSYNGRATLHAVLTGTAAPAQLASLDLTWSVVLDRVYSQKVYVGLAGNRAQPKLVAVLTHYQPTVHLDVSAPSAASVTSTKMLRLGLEHFADGTDHQLFLALLVLVTIRRARPWRRTLLGIAALTACFTLGHSVSLALAAAGVVRPGTTVIETAIAATILLTATQALRPRLSLRAELAVSTAFGLVHGFGFAEALRELSLSGTRLIAPVLGFNLGLEAAQLVALTVFALPVWLIARSRAATLAVAAAAGVVAACWTVERATSVDVSSVTALVSTPGRLSAALLAAAAAAAASRTAARGTSRALLLQAPAAPQPVSTPADRDQLSETRVVAHTCASTR